MAKATEKALLARGLDTHCAQQIAKKYTLCSLRQMNEPSLEELGIPKTVIKRIKQSQRPPIPDDIIATILADTAGHCSHCMKAASLIIHHMIPFSKTQDHKEENLIALCLNCHDRAHTKSELTQNLTADILKKAKKNWLETAKSEQARMLSKKLNVRSSLWDFINIMRILEIYRDFGFVVNDLELYDSALAAGVISKNGVPAMSKQEHHCYYLTVSDSRLLYLYMKEMLDSLICKIQPEDISEWWFSASRIFKFKSDYISLEAATIIHSPKVTCGRGQLTQGYCHYGNKKLSFSFDLFEATSVTAYQELLNKQANVVFAQLNHKEYNKKHCILSAVCLAIGRTFEPTYNRTADFHKRTRDQFRNRRQTHF
jgi:5-methylcytosine-specific restriction endonuclease McrA